MYLAMRTAGIHERLYADTPEAKPRPLPSNLAQINLTNAPLIWVGWVESEKKPGQVRVG